VCVVIALTRDVTRQKDVRAGKFMWIVLVFFLVHKSCGVVKGMEASLSQALLLSTHGRLALGATRWVIRGRQR
jgi:hypothetical protein